MDRATIPRFATLIVHLHLVQRINKDWPLSNLIPFAQGNLGDRSIKPCQFIFALEPLATKISSATVVWLPSVWPLYPSFTPLPALQNLSKVAHNPVVFPDNLFSSLHSRHPLAAPHACQFSPSFNVLILSLLASKFESIQRRI